MLNQELTGERMGLDIRGHDWLTPRVVPPHVSLDFNANATDGQGEVKRSFIGRETQLPPLEAATACKIMVVDRNRTALPAGSTVSLPTLEAFC